jgi:poly-gamma-glutamate capsule biosynthesis protein CapA/YwtB (metallophosphatase superfamily)
MRINRLLGWLLLITIFLPACAAAFKFSTTSSEAPAAGTPSTSNLSTNDPSIAYPAFDTSTPAPAITATRVPSRTPPPSLRVNLQAVGDMMLARTVGEQLLEKGPGSIFAGVQSVFDSADVLVGNLECALTSSDQQQSKSFTFAAPAQAAQALALAGFDVLSLANNHAMDFGNQGLLDTFANLGQFGIAGVGAGENAAAAHAPVILERNGLRLAFLAYLDVSGENQGFDAQSWIATATQPGIAWADLDQIKADVTAARRKADVVIVMLHSGIEITNVINNIENDQRLQARTAIDSGAALVIGSHPHVLQQIESYHGGLIAYSLGNFVFDTYKGVANATIILQVMLTPTGIESYGWVPVLIENGLPHLVTDKEVPAIGTLVGPLNPGGTSTTVPTTTFKAICTPPRCAIGSGETYYCAGVCPGGCGTTCATTTP